MNRTTSVLCLGLALWAGVTSAQERTPGTSSRSAKDDGNTIAQYRVARSGDLLLIPVVIGETEHQFMLDTGAMATVLSHSLTETLAPLKRSSRSFPKGLAQRYELPDARLAGTKLRITGDATKL